MDTIAIHWGTTSVFDVDIAEACDSSVVNLQNATLRWLAKRNISDPDAAAVITKTNAPLGGITLSSVTGTATVTINPGDTSGTANSYAAYWWQMKMWDPSSHVYAVLSGLLTVQPVIVGALP